jgi:hypothetical protein
MWDYYISPLLMGGLLCISFTDGGLLCLSFNDDNHINCYIEQSIQGPIKHQLGQIWLKNISPVQFVKDQEQIAKQ